MVVTTDVRLLEIEARVEILTPMQIVQADRARAGQLHHEREMTPDIDNTLEDSFPASDPPSWTAGVARPSPVRDVVVVARGARAMCRALQPAAAFEIPDSAHDWTLMTSASPAENRPGN
jgi:hypothetical protein